MIFLVISYEDKKQLVRFVYPWYHSDFLFFSFFSLFCLEVDFEAGLGLACLRITMSLGCAYARIVRDQVPYRIYSVDSLAPLVATLGIQRQRVLRRISAFLTCK